MPNRFESVADVRTRLAEVNYLADEGIEIGRAHV